MNRDSGSAGRVGTVQVRTERIVTRRDELGVTWWDLVVLGATLVIAVTTPLEVVFDFRSGAFGMSFSVLISLLFAADIVFRFSRPVEVEGRTVEDRATIRRHYLRTWFTVDLLAAIPFGLMAVGAADNSAAESMFRALSLLRVLRVTRFFVLQRQWRLRTSLNPAVLRLSFFVFWVAILAHWIACGWIALDGAQSGHPELLPYQQALYWTITTLTTVGYGDITPVGRSQVSYTMVVMALGAAMYGYVIGNVASLLANIDVLRSQHLGRIEAINNFLRAMAMDIRRNMLMDGRSSRKSQPECNCPLEETAPPVLPVPDARARPGAAR